MTDKPTHNPRTGLEYGRAYPAAVALRAEGRFPDGRWMPTDDQVRYVTSLQRKLSFRRQELNSLCLELHGAEFAALDKGQVSKLIDRLKELLAASETAG